MALSVIRKQKETLSEIRCGSVRLSKAESDIALQLATSNTRNDGGRLWRVLLVTMVFPERSRHCNRVNAERVGMEISGLP